MKNIIRKRIGNDHRIVWKLKKSENNKLLQTKKLCIEIKPSKAQKMIDAKDTCCMTEKYTVKKEKVILNGNIGRLHYHAGMKPKVEVNKMPPPHHHRPILCPAYYDCATDSVVATWIAPMQPHLGVYDMTLWVNLGHAGQTGVDKIHAVELVPYSTMTSDEDGTPIDIEEAIEIKDLNISLNGLSTYDLAVLHGYQGNQEQWLQEHSLIHVNEDGFFFVDENLNILFKYTDDGFDSSGNQQILVEEEGYYWVDKNMNILMQYTNDGFKAAKYDGVVTPENVPTVVDTEDENEYIINI